VRLLIVDEDRRARGVLSNLLAGLGHEVATASSAPAALARLEAGPFDLVFTELLTRRVDGMELLRTVRRRWPATRVVVLAGSPDVEAAVDAMRLGAVDCLRKPVDETRLEGVIERELAPLEGRQTPDTAVSGRRKPNGAAPPRSETFAAHELGEARLEPVHSEARVQKVLRIDATGAPTNLLGRLLVGSYITGQDQVLVTGRNGLTTAQRKEIHQVVDRTLGMSVVGDSPALVEVQNFVDPGKHELAHLIHRVVRMLQTELEACRTALVGGEAPPLQAIDTIEEEIDRLYLLMVRQLLLSSDSPRIARSIDVESHHYQIGYRLVAKVLEVTGDLIHGVGIELRGNLPGLHRISPTLIRELVIRIERLELILTRTMDAFTRLSAVDANATLNLIGEILPADTNLGRLIARRVPDRKVAIAAHRIVCNLVMALEMLIIVNEVTINRSVEPETVAHTDLRVRTGAHAPRSPRASPAPPAPPARAPDREFGMNS